MTGALSARRVGLLAGGGQFPAAFARAARAQGLEVVCVAVHGHADATLAAHVDRLHWAGVAKLGWIIRCFRREGVGCVVMAGKIHKVRLFDNWRWWRLMPDWRSVRFWRRRQGDRRDDALLLGVIEEFARDGIRCASALEVCPELLVKAGLHTRRAPTAAEVRDLAFGWRLAKEMGRLDVGQSVMVKDAAVLAVEAIEGTDRAIRRAGELCAAGGFAIVKVAKPQQDDRFDVPTIGPDTIASMKAARAKTLAVEAGRTILLDAAATIAAADAAGIALVAWTAAEADAAEKTIQPVR